MENEKLTATAQSQAEEQNLTVESEATTPNEQPIESSRQGITLKFNKEMREVPYEEAVALAQKGLKFDAIKGDFERLKNIAAKSGKSVSDYISAIEEQRITKRREELLKHSGGNEELADHVLSLENSQTETDNGLNLLCAEFPEIKSLEDLPEEVLENVELLGGNLLAAYLLYTHRQKVAGQNALNKQREVQKASVGSLSSGGRASDFAKEEFIKALWG